MNLRFYEPDSDDIERMKWVIQRRPWALESDLDQLIAQARDTIGPDVPMQDFLDSEFGEALVGELADKYALTPRAFLFLMRLAVFGPGHADV